VSKTLIIDADPIIYAAGFAAQSSTYEYVLEDEAGNVTQHAWDDGNEALRAIRANGFKVLDKAVHVDAKDVGFARQAAKTQLDSIVRKCAAEMGTSEDGMNREIYLSGPDNFRYKLATIVPYKADRPPPPVHYQALRDYLTQRWNAVVVSGIEADDRVSIRMRQLMADGEVACLATIDKDLDQVPGLHYEYKNHVFYTVDEWDAEWMFWKQVLSGDSTDNIQGLYKTGVGKAQSKLELWLKDFAAAGHDVDSQRELWRTWVWTRIVQEYMQNMTRYPEKFPEGMTPTKAALENARLVFMMEYEGQLWNPPGEPHGELSSLAAH
jgi:hypothetical protein